MRVRAAAVAALTMIGSAACTINPFGPSYEYDEQTYLEVDGSAQIVINSSIPAFVALRGLPFDPSPGTPVDVDRVREVFEQAGCTVTRVGRPWSREGRRFVQVQLETDDIRRAAACGPLGWSSYRFDVEPAEERIIYAQTVGASAKGDPGAVNWDGDEIVAFKLHLPSRVLDHNVRRLDDGETGSVDRGNILAWEQRLADRRAGTPLAMRVVMDDTSILYTTLWIFGGAFAGAVVLLGSIVWWLRRWRGPKSPT